MCSLTPFLLVLFGFVCVSAASVVHVSTGAQLAAAISEPGVQKIVVDGPIHLEEGDFGPHIVKLSRNLTITSDLAGPHQASKAVAEAAAVAWQPACQLFPS
jgi:hypothetical protein